MRWGLLEQGLGALEVDLEKCGWMRPEIVGRVIPSSCSWKPWDYLYDLKIPLTVLR